MKLVVIFFVCSLNIFAKDCVSIKAGIDIGSGTMKLKVAKVDSCLTKINSIIYEHNIPVAFKEDLKRSKSNELSTQILAKGLKALQTLKAKAQAHGAESIIAVATSAFRTASNGKKMARELSGSTDVSIKIITQKEEAMIGFFGAISKSKSDARSSVVWDIGGGSMQITAYDGNNKFIIHEGKLAAVSFKNLILSEIIKKPHLGSPNPISSSHREKALIVAKDIAIQTVEEAFKIKIKESPIIGIGGVHYYSLLKNFGKNDFYTLEDINKRLINMIGKSDKEIGGKYPSTDISNLLLVKGYMQALEIKKVQVVKVNLVEGILLNPKAAANVTSL
jgi:exopolyphosphatase/guanosine-5'-triphosphate,3'-diphosphate pyrophosphatase